MSSWVLITPDSAIGGLVAAVAAVDGPVVAVVLGPPELAELAATAGVDEVRHVTSPGAVEALAGGVAALAAEATPGLVLVGSDPSGRAIGGAIAGALGATMVAGVRAVRSDGASLIVEQTVLRGSAEVTLAASAPVVALFAGDDADVSPAAPVPVTSVEVVAAAVEVAAVASAPGAGAGLAAAPRVVSIGRGLRRAADLELIERLATALDAEVGCSMPVADDLGWVPKDHYVGRSGQHIAPRLYLAVGISGAPQHLEGVRGAKVVAAVNSDPDARIFRSADFGIVGDLYEVVPALIDALGQ